MMHSGMASGTDTRVQRTVRLDADMDAEIWAAKKASERSYEGEVRVLLREALNARREDDAAAS